MRFQTHGVQENHIEYVNKCAYKAIYDSESIIIRWELFQMSVRLLLFILLQIS